MYLSKLTTKFQATVPQPVRRILGLKTGDRLAFDVNQDMVTIRKATPLDLQFAQSLESTLSEWNSENDEEAYRDL